MSRTDKDLPLYARAEWWKPEHWNCDRDERRSSRVCDLPAEPDPARYEKTRRSRWNRRHEDWHCDWTPVWDRNPNCPTPPKWFIRHVWTGKTRVAERVHGRRAVAEYRATGTVDSELAAEQHRHCAQWLWW